LKHELIIKNIKSLVKLNKKEIVLTGVNTAGYNDNGFSFFDLLKEIDKLKGNFRVRISSLEPFQINNQIIDLLAKNKNR
jgi:threonylcarbamoyladenosine tRNA methylthiotransferase MtaB